MRFSVKLNYDGEPVCHVLGCGTPIPRKSSIPTCYECGIQIAREFRLQLAREDRDERERHAEARDAKKPVEQRWEGRHVVYYIRIGDYIKIGTTKRLKQRIAQLRASTHDLLAIEDGDALREASRHRQFAADRLDSRRENFRPSQAILEHVENLGGRATLPAWATRPDTRSVRVRSIPPSSHVP